MRGALEAVVFVGLAAAVHAAVIAGVAGRSGAPEAAGNGGVDAATLAAVPELAAVVAVWDAPPAAADKVTTPVAPEVTLANAVPARQNARPARAPVGTLAALAPDLPAQPIAHPLPQVRAKAAAALPEPAMHLTDATPLRMAALSRPRPIDRPVQPMPSLQGQVPRADTAPVPPSPARAALPPPARAELRAAGTGSTARSGAARVPEQAVAAPSAAASPALSARWGGAIRARVEARKAAPTGRWAPGRAVVRLVVARDGRVVSARLLASSGQPRLDKAALRAVARAGRMPAAPDGFGAAQASFNLPVTFMR